MEEGSTRERIILATIEGLEREGMARLTIRSIAEAAGVNVAAVNYHFGSKERLLEAVMAQTLRHGLWESLDELRQAVSEGGDNVAGSVRRYLREFVSNMIRYPRLTEAHFHDVLTRQEYGGVAVTEFNRFLEEMFQLIRPALRPGTEVEQRVSLAQLWYALVATTMMPRLFGPFLGRAPADPPVSSEYLDRLLDTFLV